MDFEAQSDDVFVKVWSDLTQEEKLALSAGVRSSCVDRYRKIMHVQSPHTDHPAKPANPVHSKAGAHGSRAYQSELRELWRAGLPPGDRTGWPDLDAHYTVAPGQLTVVTGWPGAGKSEFVDALLVNLSRQGWKFAVFSPENHPVAIHIAKLMEKLSGKPFGAGPTARLTEDEVLEYMDDLDQSFSFIEATHADGLSAKTIISVAEPYLLQFEENKRGLVLDPWNELEHSRPQHMSETEYVSQTLSMVRAWARLHNIHVWIVAHPQKMRRDDGGKLPIPRPDMISGSQHWWNKADACITVWRDFEHLESQEVTIYVQKVRFKHIGKPGYITLRYDRVTGRYHTMTRHMGSIKGLSD